MVSDLATLASAQNLIKTQEQEVENPDYLVLPDGSVRFAREDVQSESLVSSMSDEDLENHYENLVDYLNEKELLELGHELLADIADDEESRNDWLGTLRDGFDLLGVKLEEKNEPFQGACSAQHPLLMESAVKFQSKATAELLPANGPVKCKVLGDVTAEKEKQAIRVQRHLNYLITEKMTEFYNDTEKLLLYLPIVGSAFKKTYYDGVKKRPVSEFVPADQLIVSNSVSDLEKAERITHVIYKTENKLNADFASGFYTKPETMPEPSSPKLNDVQQKTNQLLGTSRGFGDSGNVYTLYECHVDLFISKFEDRPEEKKYKVASPYIVTLIAETGEILGIRRNWMPNDYETRQKKSMFTHYQFVPGFGFYGFGFLHLLGNLQMSLTAALRSLVDAGQFANLQGGFKLKGVRISGDSEPIYPGQFKDIEAGMLDINKAIMPLPFKEPSQTLYMMLEFLDRKGQKFADSTEQVIADSSNYGPVGTTMALLDASTKFFSAIHKRLHLSQKNELKVIAQINAETLDEDITYNIQNETMKVSRKDYDEVVDIVPVSDPNISSNAHRMSKAQTLLQIAQQNPELHDMRKVLEHVYINMDFVDPSSILKKEDQATPNDPITDIQNAIEGKPIKAFKGQNHKAHIAIKTAFIQDPMSGGSVMMQKASLLLQANIQEHMLLQFAEQVQAETQGETGDEDAMAQAAQTVAARNAEQIRMEQREQQEGAGEGQAAMLLAQAEMLDSQTEAQKAQYEQQYKTAELALQQKKLELETIKELNKTEQFDQKLAVELQKIMVTKGIDAMIQGLSEQFKAKSTNVTT